MTENRSGDTALSAFVLMPFDADFEGVFDELIKAPLEEIGFVVRRADSLLNQRAVLQDVVVGIAEADLIVADLTGLNPNVMYELGLAHALGKRTVMITQKIESLPFDLRPYRTTEYSTNFRDAGRLAEALREIGTAVIQGNADFGNPVQDYAPQAIGLGAQVAEVPRMRDGSSSSSTDSEGDLQDLGLLDAVEKIQLGSSAMQVVVGKIGEATKSVGQQLEAHTARLGRVQKNLGADKGLQPSLAIMRDSAKDLEAFSDEVEPLNGRLRESLQDVVTGANTVARLRTLSNETDRTAVANEIESFVRAEDAFTESYFHTSNFSTTLGSLPQMESHLTRASRRAAGIVAETAAIIEEAQAEFGRVRALLEERLASSRP